MVDKNELLNKNLENFDSSNEYGEKSMPNNYEDDKDILLEMGFKESYINKIYYFLKPNNIENAIFLMTKENNLYNHNFVGNKDINTNLCYLCEEEDKFHRNFKNTKENESEETANENIEMENFYNDLKCDNSYNSNDSNDFIDSTVFILCNICGNSVADFEMKKNGNCPSYYCNNCWYCYLKEKIENNIVCNIKCMDNCGNLLSPKFIYNIILEDKKLLNKYYLFNNFLSSNIIL